MTGPATAEGPRHQDAAERPAATADAHRQQGRHRPRAAGPGAHRRHPALTMAFTPLMPFQLFSVLSALNARADEGPLPGRHRFRDRALGLCLAGVLAVGAAAVHLPWANAVFGTVPLDAARWAAGAATASGVLLAALAARRAGRPHRSGTASR
ncbi:cation transporting ATPase C-terminal domain-containing protein [Streptomyces sp. NPDC001381]|uniref:cation transporting ATPase C-terminal domain-containing protein n=1 Tax=Streptomyces sp. NPDC001381 TaxID=3364567 RepID=UPI0036A93544